MGTYIDDIKKFEKEVEKQGPTITVSGMSCSGKSSLAEFLADELGLDFVEAGGKFWRKLAEERGLDLNELSESAEKEVDIEMDKRTLELAQKGEVILMGRLVAWAAGDWADYRIMLTASEEERARRCSGRDELSLQEALELVKGRDEEDRKRYLDRYNINVFDYSIYNLVLDTTNLKMDQVNSLVLEILKASLSL